ncbi:MAG: rhodanese-like domain-containing protein [Melioribacteraceae bacterium]|nr:rhodanese-like domain-containing protein [Melioribacteraceae bacterium]MDD3557248.1 rhodanese-like domain-containing protein [Melioribacteraceae bacterium]
MINSYPMSFFYAVSLVFSAIVISCSESVPEKNEMSADDLFHQLKTDTNIVVLDIRTEPELTSELPIINGAMHIETSEVNQRINELEPFRNKTIAVICRSGNRSRAITNLLIDKGYVVKNITDGMIGYMKAKLEEK